MLKQNKGNRNYRVFDFLHRHIIIIIIAVVVLAGGLSTIAIVRGDVSPSEEEQETVTYETMDKIYLAMDRVETLNPLVSGDSDVYYISQLLFSSLFYLDDKLGVKSQVVESYNTNAQAGSVSLEFRKDVKFSDGSSLTANDVRATINTILRIGSDGPYYEYVSKIDSVQISDTYAMTVHFEDPADAALDNLVFPIISATNYDADSDRVVGSGPYAISSYDNTKCLNLNPNKYYFGEKPENKLRFKVLPDKSKTLGLMTMEAVTAYVSRDQDADADAEDKDLNTEKISSSELEYLGFNFKNKVLAKKEVRQAIAKAIDVESLIHDNYGGCGISSDSIYFPGFLGTENKGDTYAQDLKGASDLLAAAGYRDVNEDGLLEDGEGKKVSMTILVNANDGNREDTAESIAVSLREIGIDVKIKSLGWQSYKTAVEEGAFDLYLGGYKFDKKFDLRQLFSSGNAIGYKNTTVQSYVNQMETCLSRKKQKGIYEKLKPVLADELPYYCLCYKTYAFITVPRFTGEELPTFFDIYRGCESWSWERTMVTENEEK
ncbi:ABC transporter substrate-binding protein [Emergencia sp. JLR.KK010]|uniref:ABC transporter substrate-binding protein n=1 Tax=Emergencia sp. JLR.KK010 TaxID=3114296 RepID=UPI0030D0946E